MKWLAIHLSTPTVREVRAGTKLSVTRVSPCRKPLTQKGSPLVVSLHTLFVRHFRQQLVGNPHQQQLRQPPDEYHLHPRRHLVRARLPVVDVEHHDRDDDAESDQQHREQEVLAEQRECERGRRYDFRDQEEEHGL